jgi:hypothetical protein
MKALAITTDPVTSGLSERHKKMRVRTESKCLTPPAASAAELSQVLPTCRDTVDETSWAGKRRSEGKARTNEAM